MRQDKIIDLIQQCAQVYNHPFCCFRHYIFLYEFKSLCRNTYLNICNFEAKEVNKEMLNKIDHVSNMTCSIEVVDYFKTKEKEYREML